MCERHTLCDNEVQNADREIETIYLCTCSYLWVYLIDTLIILAQAELTWHSSQDPILF